MIRRNFFQLLSGLAIPLPHWHTALRPASATTAPAPSAAQASIPAHPEWLREWLRVPRVEVFAEDLDDYNYPRLAALGEVILSHISSGQPITFRYLGGTEPGKTRTVLPVLLFYPDLFTYYQYSVEDPSEIPEPADTPLYLLSWCLSRNAPRTFRLDRMQVDSLKLNSLAPPFSLLS